MTSAFRWGAFQQDAFQIDAQTVTPCSFQDYVTDGYVDGGFVCGEAVSNDTHDAVPQWYLNWWLNQHKKKKVETVEEALEIVQETVLQAPPKVAKRPEVIAARDDAQLQLFIARQIVLASQEIQRLEDEEEEELILAMLL